MFYVTYMLSELRRRLGRTILTALGLGIGVGLVVTVTALSNGLDEAQAKILEPLTGVGTDMSVSRPIEVSAPGKWAGQRALRSAFGGGARAAPGGERWREVRPPESGRAG